jgi:alkylation response protein AidB-like acyl-CoA dehydrogenase
MALILNEEQTMLRDSARSFLAENAPVAQLRALRDGRDADGYSRPLWQAFAEMGYAGVLVPEAQGGLGLGHVEAGVVMEEIGRHLTASPFFASSVVAVSAIRASGSPLLLDRLARGDCIASLAVDEKSKHAPRHIALRARRDADGWVLDGAKTFVVDGNVADMFIVAARTSGADDDAHGVSLFAVPRSAPGVAVERTVMVDAHNAARLRFDGARVDAGALLGRVDEGAAPLQQALDAGRAAAAAELVGLADESFARTVAYLKERRQFGRLIGEFQGLQHRAAVLYCDIELARAAVLHALQRLDADPAGASDAVSVAKARAGRSATLAVQEGVQMHGGMGMTDEFELGFFMKRARVLQELFGDANFHADALARRRGY